MITDYNLAEIKKRPLYKLSALVYRAGNTHYGEADAEDFALSESDFYVGGNTIRVEGSEPLPIGNAICKCCTLTLSPSTGYEPSDFVGACLELHIKAYPYGGIGWNVTGDYYFVQSVETRNGLIILECADYMSKADVPYTPSDTHMTRTLLNLFKDVHTQTGTVFPIGYTFPEADYHFQRWMYGYTCRQILGFIAMIAGGNAVVEAGALGFAIKPLTNTDTTQTNQLDKWFSYTASPEAVKVTGLSTTVTLDIDGNELEEPYEVRSTAYSTAYAVNLFNPLFRLKEKAALNGIMAKISGFTFHAFEGDHAAYPLAEYGDYTHNTYRAGNEYSFITNIEWNINGKTHLACEVETAADNSASYESSESHGYVDSRLNIVAATEEMTQDVGITPQGNLVTKPAPGIDYIVSDVGDNRNGKIRRCRKWANGLQEHWYTIPMVNVDVSVTFGAMYRSAFESNHAYISPFVSGDAGGLPISEISFQCDSGSNPAFTWMADPTSIDISVSGVAGTALSATPKFALVRPASGTTSGKATIYTRGYWK